MKMRRRPTVTEMVQFTENSEEEIFATFGKENFTLLGDSEGFTLQFKMDNGQLAEAPEGFWIAPGNEPGTFYAIPDALVQANYVPAEILPELHEGSTGPEVFAVVSEKLRLILPESQVAIVTAVMEDHGMLEGGVPSDG